MGTEKLSAVDDHNMQPFRFLDLPKELRLMVYECLPLVLSHHTISACNNPSILDPFRRTGQFRLVTLEVSGLTILRTCHQISEEARPILSPVLEKIRLSPSRIIADVQCWKGDLFRNFMKEINRAGTLNTKLALDYPQAVSFLAQLEQQKKCDGDGEWYNDLEFALHFRTTPDDASPDWVLHYEEFGNTAVNAFFDIKCVFWVAPGGCVTSHMLLDDPSLRTDRPCYWLSKTDPKNCGPYDMSLEEWEANWAEGEKTTK